MPFTNYPDAFSSVLYPVTYRNIQPSGVEQLYVRVFVNASEVGGFHAAKTATTATSGIFDFDISGFAASNVAPFVAQQTSIFGTLNAYSRGINTDAVKALYCQAYKETINTSGFLDTSTAFETTTTGYVLSADTWGYTYKMDVFQQPVTGLMQFLTAYRSPRKIRETDNFYLSFLCYGVNAIRVRFYNSMGTLVASPIIDMIHSSATYGMETVSLGLANMIGKTVGGGLIFHEGTFPATLGSITSYLVDAGTYTGVFNLESETLQFIVEPDCSDKIEVHWFGRYGGAESFVFTGLIQGLTKTNSDIQNIARPWNVIGTTKSFPYNKQVIKTNNSYTPQIKITAALTPEEADYIASLAASPEVYICDSGNYIACTVDDATFVTSDNRAPFIDVSLTLILPTKQGSRL